MSFDRNVAVASGRAVWSSSSRFNRRPENLQQIQSWTTSLAHDLVRGRYSFAKAGLIRGKLWVSIKGSRKPSTGRKRNPKNRAKTESRNTEQKKNRTLEIENEWKIKKRKKTEPKNQPRKTEEEQRKKKAEHKLKKKTYTERRREEKSSIDREENYPCNYLSPCKKKKSNPESVKQFRKNKHTHYLLSFFISRIEKSKEGKTMGTMGGERKAVEREWQLLALQPSSSSPEAGELNSHFILCSNKHLNSAKVI